METEFILCEVGIEVSCTI